MTDQTFSYAAGSRFSPTKKLLEWQVVATTPGEGVSDASFAVDYHAWCLVAPPMTPTTDPLGKTQGAANALIAQLGDQKVVVGSRDARIAPFGQDVKPGEVALVNAFGNRLFLGQKALALNSPGGGFLSFDGDARKVGLSGIPSTVGGAAPYLSITATSLGLVSATGKASLNIADAQLTLSGSAAALDVGGLTLGKGAVDPVVLQSLMHATLVVLQAWCSTHTHPGVGTPPAVPLSLPMLIGSTRVKAA